MNKKKKKKERGEESTSTILNTKNESFERRSGGGGGGRIGHAKEIKGSNLKHQAPGVQELRQESDSQLIRLTFAMAVAAFCDCFPPSARFVIRLTDIG